MVGFGISRLVSLLMWCSCMACFHMFYSDCDDNEGVGFPSVVIN
jgi:hypothetical protein